MKFGLLFLIASFSLASFSQADSIVCGQLPFANPDTRAVYEGDLYDFFAKNLPAGLKKKGEHMGAFRILVDCNGKVTDVLMTQGNLLEGHREHYISLMYGMIWKAASNGAVKVSSFVFVTFSVLNGMVSISVSAA
jgi:hypothetical protein